MSKFKVGDKVRITKAITHDSKNKIGYVGTIVSVYNGDWSNTEDSISCGDYWYWVDNIPQWENGLELVEEPNQFLCNVGGFDVYVSKKCQLINNKNMSLISKFKSIIRSEPEKTFVKAGVLNESLELTSEGKDLFIEYLFDKNKDEFKTNVVDKLIEEDK